MTISDSMHFSHDELSEGIFATIAKVGGYAISNAGIIELGGQIVVFDTFLTPQAAMDLRRFAEGRLGRSPHIVVNSHYHNDHIWENQVFAPDAPILSSAHTRQLIATDGMEEFQWYSENSAQRLAALRSQYQEMDDEQGRSQL